MKAEAPLPTYQNDKEMIAGDNSSRVKYIEETGYDIPRIYWRETHPQEPIFSVMYLVPPPACNQAGTSNILD